MIYGSRFRDGLSFAQLRVALLFIVIAALACLSPAQSDTFWALRAGEDIWRSGTIPLTDSYSYTAAGRPWPNHEWLWQALAYGLHRLGGLPLLTGAVAMILTGAYAITYRLLAGSRTVRLVMLGAGASLGTIGWSLRPQVTSLLLVAVLLWLLVHERYWWLPWLFALWANLHGGVVLGGLLLVTATAFAFFTERRRFLRLFFVTGLALSATLLTPLGFGLWRFIVEWMLAARQTGVSEWGPLALASRGGIAFAVLGIAFVALVVWRWRAALVWPDRMLAVLGLLLLALAARAARNVPIFLLVAILAGSRLAGAATVVARPLKPSPRPDRPRTNLAILVAAAGLAVTAVGICWSTPLQRLGWRPMAPAAVAAIAGCPAPRYNSYEAGGFLLWFVRGQRVFIDSRHDPYPPDFVIADREVETGGDHRALFDRYGFRCAVLATDAKLASRLRAEGWIPRYQDAQWVVLARAR